jgi:hypothetical protein
VTCERYCHFSFVAVGHLLVGSQGKGLVVSIEEMSECKRCGLTFEAIGWRLAGVKH